MSVPIGTQAADHEWIDHTAEVTMRVRAASFAELLAEAGRAFAALVPDHLGGAPDPHWRSFALGGGDRPSTLVGWLNELVFLAEAEAWVPTVIEVADAGGDEDTTRLRARGRRLERPFVLVKAATLHGVHLHDTEDGRLQADVTLDI